MKHLAQSWDWPSDWRRPRLNVWCMPPDGRCEPMFREPESDSVVYEPALSDCEPCLAARALALHQVRPATAGASTSAAAPAPAPGPGGKPR